MASRYVMFMFALVLVHATARNMPEVTKPNNKVQTHDKNSNTEILSTAPTPSTGGGLNDKKNFVTFGGIGSCSGIGGYGGILPTLGGTGGGLGGAGGGLGGAGGGLGGAGGGLGGAGVKGIGGVGAAGGVGGVGGLGVGGGIGGYKGVGVIIP